MKYVAERLPDWRMKQFGEMASLIRMEGCKDAYIANPVTTLEYVANSNPYPYHYQCGGAK